MDLHGQLENTVVGIHPRDHHWLALIFELGQVPEEFEDGLVEPGSGKMENGSPLETLCHLVLTLMTGLEFEFGHETCQSLPFLCTKQRWTWPRGSCWRRSCGLRFKQVVGLRQEE